MPRASVSVATPVKNTFIHYDEVVEAPTKLRRVSSAPAEFRGSGDVRQTAISPTAAEAQKHSDSVAADDLQADRSKDRPRREASKGDAQALVEMPQSNTGEVAEEQHFAPARKKARVVSSEDENGIHSKQLNTDHGEDVHVEAQSRARGRSVTRSSSRSQPRIDTGGSIAKELTEHERLDKAKEWISGVKETAGYTAYLESRKAGDAAALAAPRTPDPSLRIRSKRKWERAIMSWRISLRRWGPVSVSTEEEA